MIPYCLKEERILSYIGALLVTGRINSYWADELLSFFFPERQLPAEKNLPQDEPTSAALLQILLKNHIRSYSRLKARVPAIEEYDPVAPAQFLLRNIQKRFSPAEQAAILSFLQKKGF